MLVVGVNRVLNWVQILNSGRHYTCPLKEFNGELYFEFKNSWHKLMDFLSDYAEELVEVQGLYIIRKISK